MIATILQHLLPLMYNRKQIIRRKKEFYGQEIPRKYLKNKSKLKNLAILSAFKKFGNFISFL